MHFTVANHGLSRKPDGYINYDNVEFDDIPSMTTSGYNYCACRLKNNYRRDNNFDGCVDVLIIDIDEACSIEQAEIIFEEYEYWIITTKSHQKDKGGIVCDRFRLFLMLDQTIHIREHIEEIYNRFIDTYPFIDEKCRNVSRHFYSSPKDAITIKHNGRKYSVSLSYMDDDIPKQEKTIVEPSDDIYKWNEIHERWETDNGEILYQDKGGSNEEVKLKGVDKFLEMEYYQGNKSVCLFKAASMMKGDGFDDEFIADYLVAYWNSQASRGDKLRDAIRQIKSGIKRG